MDENGIKILWPPLRVATILAVVAYGGKRLVVLEKQPDLETSGRNLNHKR